MNEPEVDVVVAVHTPERRVERAVLSVVLTEAPVRVTVVCHGTPLEPIAERLGVLAEDPRVRLLPYVDGVPSPAGPFNAGLDAATAPWVSVLGSDDVLEVGAIDSWLALAARTGAEAVLPRLRHAEGAVVPTPPARPRRTRGLDLVRDRLAYRTAPLGLLSRAALDRLGLRMTPGLPSGEDLAPSTLLWAGARGVAFDRRGPAYVIGADAAERVTLTVRPVADDLAPVLDLVARPALRAADARVRAAVAAKLVRIHILAAVHNRRTTGLDDADRAALAEGADAVVALAPTVLDVLSRAERDLLDAIAAGATTEQLVRLSDRRRRHGTPATLVPRDLRCALAREAPLRLMAASVLVR
ncbi:glycosyltransferase family 2 protein [Flavimobilis sp. GY10621]|uniref:Glycosyltransferase family 2 protein n=1 Tax=Flavimobilis rhizosphaerae TaxID=2775421 RepID=A0ABR9DP87_9MICO|nr:glycosyltransferase family A protein [Flavimobilis rhizosphaerae]MBD9698926.1 glycosyltransferase family 2 protein [Flavimobilis rhizosphaerae]